MIARLTGILAHKSPAYQIIDVQGVGYQIFTSLSTFYQLPELGEKVALRIHTHLREEALKLFGFATEDEQSLFEKLIGVSKVGPKLALTILSGLNAGELVMAVTNHDIDKLTGIPRLESRGREPRRGRGGHPGQGFGGGVRRLLSLCRRPAGRRRGRRRGGHPAGRVDPR